eukprot:jgi/Botrbrau1/10891/Bobra.0025s0067.2
MHLPKMIFRHHNSLKYVDSVHGVCGWANLLLARRSPLASSLTLNVVSRRVRRRVKEFGEDAEISYEAILQEVTDVKPADLRAWVDTNRDRLSISFMFWLADREEEAEGAGKTRLGQLCGRLTAYREGLDGTRLDAFAPVQDGTAFGTSGGTIQGEGSQARGESPGGAEQADGSLEGDSVPPGSPGDGHEGARGRDHDAGGTWMDERGTEEDSGVGTGGSLTLKDLDGEAMSLERRWAALGRLSLGDRLSPEGAALANRQVEELEEGLREMRDRSRRELVGRRYLSPEQNRQRKGLERWMRLSAFSWHCWMFPTARNGWPCYPKPLRLLERKLLQKSSKGRVPAVPRGRTRTCSSRRRCVCSRPWR